MELVASSADDFDLYGGHSIDRVEEWKRSYWYPELPQEETKPTTTTAAATAAAAASSKEGSSGAGRPSRMQICDWKQVSVLLACSCPLDCPPPASPRDVPGHTHGTPDEKEEAFSGSPRELDRVSSIGRVAGGLLGYLFRNHSTVGGLK